MMRRSLPFRRLWVALAMPLAFGGCSEEPVPVQELFTLRNQGLLHLERGLLQEAEAEFARLVQLAPDEPLGHANLGLTLLRAGQFEEAEDHLLRARELDPGNVEIALMLARLYTATDRADEARDLLQERNGETPDVRLLYALAELDQESGDAAGQAAYRARLRSILELDAANLPVRLRLAQALLASGEADSTLSQLEEIRRIPPEPPADALPLLESALAALRSGELDSAAVALDDFHQAMQVTAPYQAAIAEMGWVEGPLRGRPVLTFAPEDFLATRALNDSAAGVAFIDATAGSGLPAAGGGGVPALAAADVDGDDRPELLLSPTADAPAALYRVRAGQFMPLAGDFELPLDEPVSHAAFGDVDNDGWLDLFVLGRSGGAHLLRNRRNGSFELVPGSGISNPRGATRSAFVDVDHDGDLDLLLVGGRGTALYRNNLDGTFSEVSEEFGVAGISAEDVDFADFDGDGRIDLLLSGGGTGAAILQNEGARRFVDVTASTGLETGPGAGPGAIADLDNDGFFDLVIAGGSGTEAGIWLGERDGTFTPDPRAAAALQNLPAGTEALQPLDFDNDGWLDLVAVGGQGTDPVVLLGNDGSGGLTNRSEILPGTSGSASIVRVVDIDDDGDQDLLVGETSGAVRLLRNDGGNLNRAVRIELHALGAGSGKNNDFGIGSRLELRVGDTLQTRVVTQPVTHFGLGSRLKADVLRVEWPNGVPQILYFPGSDQDVLELENLKGSCAFLYTWDGAGFRFVTDVMWRSALGMPLGLMGQGGGTLYAPAGPSREYLRVPGEALQPRDGRYLLQLTEELWETAYLDEVRLLAVDRPDSVEVFVDERFVPPGPVDLRLYALAGARAPLSAVDGRGTDLLAALREKDDVYVDNLVRTRYQGLVEPHDLILDLGEVAGIPGSVLVLRGWIYPTDASINVALSQQTELTPQAPVLEVRNGAGEWVAAADLSFPSGKDKTVVVELEGLFPTDDHRVRMRTNLQIYWDQAFVAREIAEPDMHVEPLTLAAADLHYRGFSRMYRKGGRYGPHWFDYEEVSEESPWRPITGAFTRFGDVLPLVREADDRYVIMAPGDEATVEFDAASAGGVPEGWRRDFLLYTVGWIKDSDLNTAYGDTVAPLPFHGIQEYPYAAGEGYPDDAEHRQYRREYNTRIVERR